MKPIRQADLFPALKGGVSRGLRGYLPFVGATLLWFTMNDRGFLMTRGIQPIALFIMFKAPFKSLCSLCPFGAVDYSSWFSLYFDVVVGAVLGRIILNDYKHLDSVLLCLQLNGFH
jgi:hypothetical protein